MDGDGLWEWGVQVEEGQWMVSGCVSKQIAQDEGLVMSSLGNPCGGSEYVAWELKKKKLTSGRCFAALAASLEPSLRHSCFRFCVFSKRHM
jgi:hypothetical protein